MMESKMEKKGGRRLSGILKMNLPLRPLVSIITISFNAASTIQKTIDSVLALVYPNIEYIIIDGGSTDDTLNIIKKYESHIDYWISERDNGIYDGMNKGIDEATGMWINFMNCGDRFASATSLNFFESIQDDSDIIYGKAMIEYPEFTVPFKNLPLEQMWKRMPVCHQATFTRLSVMKHYMFDLSYKLSGDFDFIYKAWLHKHKFRFVNEVICIFDFTAGASIKFVFTSVKERRSIVGKQSFNFQKWVYHSVAILYIYSAYYFKKTAGQKLTNFITRLLLRDSEKEFPLKRK